jgi:alkylated DNA repair dioxygenase AlkB
VSELQLGFFGAGEPTVNVGSVPERTQLDGSAWVEVWRDWLLGSDTLCKELIRDIPWGQRRRRMYQRVVDEPRLTWRAGPADDQAPHPALKMVGEALEELYHVPLVGPGLNYYRDGRDSVAFHGDRELRLLNDTLVAIVTLGATRPFLLRPLGGGRSTDLRPASGDLLVMGGACQALFEHGVPKIASCGPRISASWRWVGQPESTPPA